MMATVLAGFWSLMSGTFCGDDAARRGLAGLTRSLMQCLVKQETFNMAIYELDGQGPELPATETISSPTPPR